MENQMLCPADPTTFPLPSLPIISSPQSDPLFHTPHLIGAAVLVSPDDPFLPEIAAAQAGDATLSALITTLKRGLGGEANPALPAGSPSGRSGSGPYVLQQGLLYNRGCIFIPPTSTSLILKILQQHHDAPLAGHYGVARTQALVG